MMRYAYSIVGAFALAGIAGAVLPHQQRGQQQTAEGRLAAPGKDAALSLDRWQAKRLPSLPSGMTLAMIRAGDSIYRGKGGCVTCHGPDAMGVGNSGSALSMGLNFIPIEWQAIDSLVTAGIPEGLTRSSIAMPARGASSNLTPEEVRQVAAYVWAIAQTAGEPWPGGHRTH